MKIFPFLKEDRVIDTEIPKAEYLYENDVIL